MKSKIISFLSSVGGLIAGTCGSACGAICLSGGCCGGVLMLGLLGLSGSTWQFFEKLTPVFLLITIFSLAYGFYNAYKPKPVTCCSTNNDTNENVCSSKKTNGSFLQSKTFLWAVTLFCAILWIYSFANKINNSESKGCSSGTDTVDTTSSPFITKYTWKQK